jgi:drug/metabolite transporter (DMT)-like permease
LPRRLLIYLSLAYVILAWALNTVLAKQAVAEMNPLAFTFLRFIAMTPMAFALARASGSRIHVERRDIPLLVLCGACGFGIYQYCWIVGLAHTSSFASSLLSATSPIFTLAIVAALGFERVRGGRWFGAGIALIGIAVFEGLFSGNAAFRIGDFLTLLAAMLWAVYNVASARLLARYTPLELLAITMAIGGIMIAPGGIPAIVHTNYGHIGWDVWWRLIYATLFPILLTYPVWSYGIAKLGAGKVSFFSFLVPVATGLLSIPIAHAAYAHYQIFGAAITLAGMILAYSLSRGPIGVPELAQQTSPK